MIFLFGYFLSLSCSHCQVNCYDLVGSVPPETEKHVKKLFSSLGVHLSQQHPIAPEPRLPSSPHPSQGNGLAPCLVVLKNIHALQKTQNSEIGEGVTICVSFVRFENVILIISIHCLRFD
jgi:hypothetical protein